MHSPDSDVKCFGQLSHRLPSGVPLGNHHLLPSVKSRLAAKGDTKVASALYASLGAVLDQASLKLRQPAQNGQQQFAMRRGRVAPRVVKRPKLGARLLNLVHDVEQISGRPRHTIELLDHDNVGRLKRLKHATELRTVLGFGT